MYVHGGIYLCGVGRGALNCHPKATNKKQNILTSWSLRVRSWNEECRVWVGRKIAVISRAKIDPSWDFVDDCDPVITAATAAERHKNDLIHRQGNLVGHDIVLDVVRDALTESLEGEAE